VLGIERADSASPVLFTSVERTTLEAVQRSAASLTTEGPELGTT